jgi:hypothetical protein
MHEKAPLQHWWHGIPLIEDTFFERNSVDTELHSRERNSIHPDERSMRLMMVPGGK